MDKDLHSRRRPRSATPRTRQDQRYDLPRTVLRGGDPVRGGHPGGPGHAGKARLMQATGRHMRPSGRLSTMVNVALGTLLFICVQLLAPFACTATPALAESGYEPKTVTFSNEYRHQLDGQEAYCTDIDVTPPPEGDVVAYWSSGPLMLDYVLYHAEGGADVVYGWEPTRYAVWAIMHNDVRYLTTYGSGDPMPAWFSDQVTQIYYDAQAWVDAGAQGPERGCSRIYAPSSNAYQPVAICVPQLGELVLQKLSSRDDITAGSVCYGLMDARYTVYSDKDLRVPVGTLSTDSEGHASSLTLPQGTYWVREDKAPLGYLRDSKVYEAEVVACATTTIGGEAVYDEPVTMQVAALVRKADAEMRAGGTRNSAQGDATLAGALFTIERFDNVGGDVTGTPTHSWTITTDETGFASMDDSHLVSGEPYRDSAGSIVLPLGTYRIREVQAPEGYLLPDNQDGVFVVEQQGERAALRIVSGPALEAPRAHDPLFEVGDQPVRGGVKLGKIDAWRGDHQPQGGASLAGAVMAVEVVSAQPVMVDGKTFTTGQVVTTLTTDASGTASTAADALPYGTYEAYEVEAPEGYHLTPRSEWSVRFEIREDGVIVDLSDSSSSVPDAPVRGDLSFVKVDGVSMKRLGGVPFVIESLTTGERHVLVTDENGQASTSASFNAHTNQTNANDFVLDNDDWYAPSDLTAQDGAGDEAPEAAATEEEVATPDEVEAEATDADVVDESSLLEGEGIDPDGEHEANEEAMALEEAPGEAQESDAPDEPTVPEDPDAADGADTEGADASVDEALSNEALATGEPVAAPMEDPSEAPDASLSEPELSDCATQATPLDANAGIWFSGGIDLTLEADDQLGALPYDTYRITELRCPANEGYDLVSFEVRVSRDQFVIDCGTVDDALLPSIQTQLAATSMSEDGSIIRFVDTVYYANLAADGTEYEVCGSLHLVGPDGSDAGVLVDESGQEARSQVTLRPKSTTGSVDVPFEIDVSSLREQTVVAFEELWLNGELLASHADSTDPDQSFTVPGIGTTLTGADGTKEVAGSDAVTLVDTVSYEGLIPGKAYVLSGTLMDKATGEPLLDARGEAVRAETTFVPEEPSGQAEVTFTFDGSFARGKEIVAFESLRHEGIELAVHADINDENQTVSVPAIGTTVRDAKDGDREVLAESTAGVVDTVSYQGLIPGVEYHLVGWLVNRATGDDVVIGDEPITSEVTFVPEESSGSIDMAFSFDGTALAGTQVTVFETLERDGLVVATHHDRSSEEQSFSVPHIGTTATSDTAEKHIAAASKQTIIDTVTYEGLTPGRSYRVTGTLHLRDARGGDAGVLLDSKKKPVEASATFTPTTSSGTVQVAFEVDTTELSGHDLVAFEVLTTAEENWVVAVHEDIGDKDQTVTVDVPPEEPVEPEKPTTERTVRSAIPKMGDEALPAAAFLVLSCAALALGFALRKASEERL